MANTQLERFENPGTLTKLGGHVAPLLHWESSRPAERAVAVSKVAGAVAIAGGGAELAIHAANAAPVIGSDLTGMGVVGAGLWGYTTLVRHLGIPAKDLGRATASVAIGSTGFLTVLATVEAATYHGANLVSHVAGECVPALGIIVPTAAVSYGWSRVARREAGAAAPPSLADF